MVVVLTCLTACDLIGWRVKKLDVTQHFGGFFFSTLEDLKNKNRPKNNQLPASLDHLKLEQCLKHCLLTLPIPYAVHYGYSVGSKVI